MSKRPEKPARSSPVDGADNVIPMPARTDLIDECSDWLSKAERGLSEQETASFQEWLARAPEHSRAFFEMAALWDRMDSLSRLKDLFPEPVRHRPRRRMAPMAMAASIVLAASIGMWALFDFGPFRGGEVDEDSHVAAQIDQPKYETAVGEQSSVQLPDGSILTLNTNSSVRTELSETERSVYLDRGELHVRVAHDPSRPFNVLIRGKMVRAVGTEFNVEIKDDQHIELIVTEGKVLVGILDLDLAASEPRRLSADGGPELAVEAGQRVVLGDDDEEVEPIEPEEIEVKLSWRGGDLIFRGESLEEAIDEIERYTPVEFVIQGDDLKKVRVAGLFKAGDVEGLLTTLKENFNIAYERVGDEQIILSTH